MVEAGTGAVARSLVAGGKGARRSFYFGRADLLRKRLLCRVAHQRNSNRNQNKQRIQMLMTADDDHTAVKLVVNIILCDVRCLSIIDVQYFHIVYNDYYL